MINSVLGIDVGYSVKKDTTSFCLLRWDEKRVTIKTKNTGSDAHQREQDLLALIPKNSHLLAAAIDGPLAKDLKHVTHYRAAEALLSRGFFAKKGKARGKPGQTSSGNGQKLHKHAISLANIVMKLAKTEHLTLGKSSHDEAITEPAIVEAFPNQFLAALIPEKSLPEKNKKSEKWSDLYWEACLDHHLLNKLLNFLLPGREALDFSECTDHEERAGVVCALTALGVALKKWTGVGDPIDGDIILPSCRSWGRGIGSAMPWMESALRENLPFVHAGANHKNHQSARINTHEGSWIMK